MIRALSQQQSLNLHNVEDSACNSSDAESSFIGVEASLFVDFKGWTCYIERLEKLTRKFCFKNKAATSKNIFEELGI